LAEERTIHLSPIQERTPGPQAAAPLPGTPKGNSLGLDAADATRLILASLEDDKAEDIVAIDIRGKSSVADMMIIASGRSQRHVGALADHVTEKLKAAGAGQIRVEGLPHCDWVLVDAGDVIVHIFRPEVRGFYHLEKLWSHEPAAARA
jgi:ribosome-associated protein